MYKYPHLVMCVFFCITIAAVLFSVLRVRPSDETYYHELMALNQLCKDQESSLKSEYRSEDITKELWSSGRRMRIVSPRAHMTIARSNQQIHIVEHLEKPDCLMQEKLFFCSQSANAEQKPMQRIRALQAHDASYNYVKGSFTANQATLQTYEIEGHELPQYIKVGSPPLMQGVAQTVEIERKGNKAFDFTATQLKMTFDMKKKV